MRRTIVPELLDSLPCAHPGAVGSRRDLRIINRILGTAGWLRGQLRQPPGGPGHCIEIGAGDGTLARQLAGLPDVRRYRALDLAPAPPDLPPELDWIQGDLNEARHYEGSDCLIAALVLHHFAASELSTLGAILRASSIRRILAVEPCRRRRHQRLARAGRWIGFNEVTLHDAPASVAAGFRGEELAEALGLSDREWLCTAAETRLGAYRFTARRK